ncbi:uncharacterized protein [Rutidosis leptorrhynchoides]|uniref:uncharacterized protein n=1 Tax=Rutidosis leptorrhynchoides TaxID=125765 RepID=UPI003A9A6266
MDRCSRDQNCGIIPTWDWVRSPNGRTLDELYNINELLSNFKFADGNRDKWACNLFENGGFTVYSLSKLIDEKVLSPNIGAKCTDQVDFLPKKVGLFVWRAKQNRIPVRVELDKRGIDLDSVRCPVCDNDLETVEHIFIHCQFAKDLWLRVFRWWNLSRLPYENMGELFQGCVDSNHPELRSKLWKAIEWVCGYMIWRNRNLTVFQEKKGNSSMTLNELQIKAFEWISRRSQKLNISWSQWLLNPSLFDVYG